MSSPDMDPAQSVAFLIHTLANDPKVRVVSVFVSRALFDLDAGSRCPSRAERSQDEAETGRNRIERTT